MAKSDHYYYNNFIDAAECCCLAAKYLQSCLSNYDYGQIKEMLEKMHRYEHDADEKKHEMSAALAKAFVTPLDREDLAQISQNIDDVIDCIDEVLQRFYVNRIQFVVPESIEFSSRLVSCCDLMKQILAELKNYRKPKKLHEMIIDLNHMEEECDQLYLKASLAIMDHTSDPLTILFWREIFERLEMCADACEHVGDCVETIVMKNT